MSKRKAMFFAIKNIEAIPLSNTFIGGVGGSYIENASEYVAITTGLDIGNISNFEVDGDNNVSMLIDTDFYDSNGLMFYLLSELTYFIDVDGYMENYGNSFIGNSNLKYLYAKGCIASSVNGNTTSGLTNLEKSNLNALSEIASRGFFNGTSKIKILKLPSATHNTQGVNQGYFNFTGMTSLKRLYIPQLTTFSLSALNSAMLATQWQNIGIGCKVFYNPDLGIMDRKAFNTITFINNETVSGDIFYVDGRTYTCVNGAPTTDGEFEFLTTGFAIAQNFQAALIADTRVGANDFNYIYFNGTVILQYKTVGVAGEKTTSKDISNTGVTDFRYTTLKGGNDVAPMLLNFRELRGCILTEVTAPILVNPPTTLNYTNLTSNSVDLNFTLPVSNANGNDGFEVWVDDSTIYRKYFEYDEITTSGNTLDLTEIVSDTNGNGITGLIIKIRTIDGQMNYSEFSNEITLP